MEQTKIGRNGLYYIDNSAEDWNVREYLRQMCDVSKQMDVATGYLEIGGMLDLDQEWQKLDKIRIIMGNEVTKRTQEVINKVVETLLLRVRDSVDKEQEQNEFLLGVHGIVEAMKSRKIECRVYDKDKFHATITWSFPDRIFSPVPPVLNVRNMRRMICIQPGSSNRSCLLISLSYGNNVLRGV